MTSTTKHTGPITAADYAYRYYCVHIDAGITLADLLKPEMWSQNTDGQLRPNDRVRVISKSGAFDCDLIVKAIMPGAGVIMQIDDAAVPGSPTRTRLQAIAASVRSDEVAKNEAELQAAIGGAR
jgi:hypothetical protein